MPKVRARKTAGKIRGISFDSRDIILVFFWFFLGGFFLTILLVCTWEDAIQLKNQ